MAFVEPKCLARRGHTLAVAVTTLQAQEVGEGLTRFNEPICYAWEDLERWQIEDGQARRCLPNLDMLYVTGLAAAGAGGDDGRLREASYLRTMRHAPTPTCGGGSDGAQGSIHRSS